MKVKSFSLLILMVFLFSSLPIIPESGTVSDEPVSSDSKNITTLSSDSGVQVDPEPYLIIQMHDSTIPSEGNALTNLLSSYGIVCSVVNVSDVVSDPELLAAPTIVLDPSVGSDNGTSLQNSFLSLITVCDTPLILIGRAAWVLHRMLGTATPNKTASLHTILRSTGDFEDAVFLSYPHHLTLDASVTTEEDLSLPVEDPRSPSLILNLTGSTSPAAHPALRYTSWPSDIFLFGPELSGITANGEQFLVNIIAFATTLRESSSAMMLQTLQAGKEETLGGGLRYSHEPTLTSTYYAVKAMKSILNLSTWLCWKDDHQDMITNLLNTLILDYGSESGFADSATEGTVTLITTAYGLWTVAAMELESQFSVSELSAYISSRQLSNGSFANRIDHTFYAVEAMNEAEALGALDTTELESWLWDCVIGSEGPPDHWGGVGKNPDTLEHWNLYASHYVLCLDMLGKEHNDKVKLTQRIQSTGNSDGSFNDTIGVMRYHGPVIGTTSSLNAMAVMGTLSSENKTSGMAWLSGNQLDSGGFGCESIEDDIVGKTKYTCFVAECLNLTDETSRSMGLNIESYVHGIESTLGFESMELLPTIMWTNWISKVSRYVHAGGIMDYSAINEYLGNYDYSFSQYPTWANLSLILPPEYDYLDANIQYKTESVWTQYFGVSASKYIGHNIPSLQRSAISGYITSCQYPRPTEGHFTLSGSGTAHMQYSVAAVEALYLLDELDEITWRSWLETAILSEYSSGQWDSSGWTLKPYTGQQSAIDYLSTRAALRLDLVTPTMAGEIESAINSRIQYTDLWALSRDVATMSLLNKSGFVVHTSIDRQQVISALGSEPFPDGWYNSTSLYQPVITADVLEMISILGLSPQLSQANGTAINSSIQTSATIGENVNLDISINSTLSTHTVHVNAFDQCLQYDNVANSDTLVLPVPADSPLGPANIQLIVHDFGNSRGFNTTTIEIWCTLEGSLTVDSSWVLQGDLINGIVSWSRAGGEDAGTTHIVLKLEDEEWSYDDVSPFSFSLATDTISEGKHNLTANLTQNFCDNLVLWEEVTVAEPDPTYISSDSFIGSPVNQELDIPWSLHFQENDSYVSSQNVTLEIRDSSQILVHTDYQISTFGILEFYWTPTITDDYSFILTFNQNGTLEYSESTGTIHVTQNTTLDWVLSSQYDQYESISISALLTTDTLELLPGETISVLITSPSLQTVVDSQYITNSTGHIDVEFTLQENGVYILDATFSGTQYLNESDCTEPLLAWSTSTLNIGEIPQTGLITKVWNIWAKLEDSLGNPVSGQIVNMTITYLPSTVVLEQAFITNSTGFVNLQWQASSVGDYLIETEFEGTLSRGSAYDSSNLEIRALVTLTITHTADLEVGITGWICVTAEDDYGPLSGFDVWIAVKDPYDTTVLEISGTTVDGKFNTTWTPTERGTNNISAWSEEQSWYEASSTFLFADVYEKPTIEISLPECTAPDSGTITITVVDISLSPVQDANVSISVLLNEVSIFDEIRTTDALGQVTISIDVGEPGQLSVMIELETQGWLLSASNEDNKNILGQTDIELNLTGFPISQGTALGIIATVTAWDSSPLLNSNVTLGVLYPNGTIINMAEINSTSYGTCLLYHEFNEVGDFNVTANFEGGGLQAPESVSMVQRVQVVPALNLIHDSTGLAGEPVDFYMWMCDALGAYIQDRILNLTIWMNSEAVYSIEVMSSDTPVVTSWTPTDRGLATATLTHVGDGIFFTNSTQSILTILDQVQGTIEVSSSTMDLFEEVTISYTLTMDSNPDGIPIVFEILGLDLVPIWEQTVLTNETGIAEFDYLANHSYGQLTIEGRPDEEEFLTGGEAQFDLTVMTQCIITCELLPSPPVVDSELNITISGMDELGGVIDGLDVKVYLWEPSGDQIKLGLFTLYITKTLEEGSTWVSFTPDNSGYYNINITSSGSTLIHGFIEQFQRIVYCPTLLSMTANSTEVTVNDAVLLSIELLDVYESPLESKLITLTLDGPNSHFIGPLELTTDSEGMVTWEGVIDEVGLWNAEVKFNGLGIYLEDEYSLGIDAIYGTQIGVAILDTGEIIAGINPVSLTVYLEDSAGNPLEGRTINYEVHHDNLGKVDQGSLSMSGALPEPLDISFLHMGNHTIVFSYNGTAHYTPSNSAVRVFVRGTTSVSVTYASTLDRSENYSIHIEFLNEVEEALSPDSLDTSIILSGPEGEVNLTDILDIEDERLTVSLLGLKVGDYTLNDTVLDSNERLGSSITVGFNITAYSNINVYSQDVSGIVGEEQSVTLLLSDSMNEPILDSILYISIYDPNGKEIYGSIIKDRTPVDTKNGLVEIIWTPHKAGKYEIFAEFEGLPFISGTNETIETALRYSCELTVLSPESVTYPDEPRISFTLISSIGGVADASINITIIHTNGSIHWFTHSTNTRGSGQVSLGNLLAGDYDVFLTYSGSEQYIPCWILTNVSIKPTAKIELVQVENSVISGNCTIYFQTVVHGVDSVWIGTAKIQHIYDGQVLHDWMYEVQDVSSFTIFFTPEDIGEHSLCVILSKLPTISNFSEILIFSISEPPVTLPKKILIESPLYIVVIILPVVSAVVRKRLGGWLSNITGEWEE
jgi:prenyltransferase beta subunit